MGNADSTTMNPRRADHLARLGLLHAPMGYVDGANLYEFVHDDPTNRTDPTGLYDSAGHFYTTYMVAIAAGMTPAQAYELAYYSQLPDQIADYDAVNAFKILNEPVQMNPGLGGVAKAMMDQHLKDVAWAQDVQELLHSLHGGAAGPRQACLLKLIQSGNLTPWERGLLIHAFGDSFAHTKGPNNSVAYGGDWGHGLAGHEPDIIGNNPRLYQLYVHDLYLALGGNAASEATNIRLQQIKNIANGFAGNDDSAWQIKMMRKLASTPMFGYANPYAPEAGGIDPAMDSLDRKRIQTLLNKIANACGCTSKGSGVGN